MPNLSLSRKLALAEPSYLEVTAPNTSAREPSSDFHKSREVETHVACESPLSERGCGPDKKLPSCDASSTPCGSEPDEVSDWEECDEDNNEETGKDEIHSDVMEMAQERAKKQPESEAPQRRAGVATVGDESASKTIGGREHRMCQICGADISFLNFVRQVQHVKRCMVARGNPTGHTSRLPKPNPAALHGQVVAGPSSPNPLDCVSKMDVQEWLKVRLKLEFNVASSLCTLLGFRRAGVRTKSTCFARPILSPVVHCAKVCSCHFFSFRDWIWSNTKRYSLQRK